MHIKGNVSNVYTAYVCWTNTPPAPSQSVTHTALGQHSISLRKYFLKGFSFERTHRSQGTIQTIKKGVPKCPKATLLAGYTRTHTRKHTHKHTRTHARTHTHTRTHARAQAQCNFLWSGYNCIVAERLLFNIIYP